MNRREAVADAVLEFAVHETVRALRHGASREAAYWRLLHSAIAAEMVLGGAK